MSLCYAATVSDVEAVRAGRDLAENDRTKETKGRARDSSNGGGSTIQQSDI